MVGIHYSSSAALHCLHFTDNLDLDLCLPNPSLLFNSATAMEPSSGKEASERFMELTTNPTHRYSSTDVHHHMPNPHLLHGEAKSSAMQETPEQASRHRTGSLFDAESQAASTISSTDPLALARRLKSKSELDRITANTARKRNACNPLTLTGHMPQSKLAHFYETQNTQIERFLKPVDQHVQEARDTHSANNLRYQIAVYGSFAANILLAGLQLYGAIASGSLSLFTTMADAIFDPLSNITLILSNKAVKKVDARRFPAGKARIETAGNIVFCFLMTAVSFILIAFSIRELVQGSQSETKNFHLPSVIAVSVAFCTKLALFLYCWALRNQYSQIRILWEDHRNDLFINGFGVLTSVGGSKLKWWLDPAGAIVLSVLISVLWLRTSYSEFQLLIGITADTETLQLITYVSMTHSDRIKQIDTVRAWHSGPRLVVEVDVVIDPEESLRVSHDIAEELQMKLESLPDVERAYVHCDYECTHKPEHFLKKEL
jgi:cation diffusion facilitator family transporter